jgi:hypothetical protein
MDIRHCTESLLLTHLIDIPLLRLCVHFEDHSHEPPYAILGHDYNNDRYVQGAWAGL